MTEVSKHPYCWPEVPDIKVGTKDQTCCEILTPEKIFKGKIYKLSRHKDHREAFRALPGQPVCHKKKVDGTIPPPVIKD